MLAALVISALTPTIRAHAILATWTVNTTTDSNDGVCNSSSCSLREAISVATDGDNIVFAPGLTGTIHLAGGIGNGTYLYISSNIKINGPGISSLTITGDDQVGVFYISVGKNVQISNLTITHGHNINFGGGILNSGILTLDHVAVTYNQAVPTIPGNATYGGGIFNNEAASLTITNSSLSHNSATYQGGAIYNDKGAGLSMTEVTVDSNHAPGTGGGAGDGGGLYISNPVSITPSGPIVLDRMSITNNTAPTIGSGGGISLHASATISNSLIAGNSAATGGGLNVDESGSSSQSVTISLTNVTISGNSATHAGGGMAAYFSSDSDSVTLNNVTIALNEQTDASGYGGGLYEEGTHHEVFLENSILSGNIGAGAFSADCVGTFNSLDYNLIQDAADCNLTGSTTHTITGLSANLGVLAYHGGATHTKPLLAGSPAIDAGNDATCALIDQRGAARPHGAHCDMGAYEYGPFTWVVTNLLDHLDGLCDSDCTLAEALTYAGSGDTISFAGGLTGTITLSHTYALNSNLSIIGPGAGSLSISPSGSDRVFGIGSLVVVSISNLSIINGYTMDSDGGCMYNYGTLTLDHVTLSNCQALSSTSANGQGGAIANYRNLVITNSSIVNNTAQNKGGGIFGFGGASLSMTNTRVDNNHATMGLGGGLYIPNPAGDPDGTITLDRLSVTNNSSYSGAAGIFFSASGSLTNSLIANNTTTALTGAGGGIQMLESGGGDNPVTITLTNDTISGNTAYGQGGGISASLQQAADSVVLNNVTISNNHRTVIPGPPAIHGGGGIFAAGPEHLDLENTILSGNTTGYYNGSLVGGPDCEGTVNSLDYNLIQDTTSCTFTGTTTHNITGVSALLGTLANNGGSTQTMSLLNGSPAIDSAGATCATTDQRGISRPQPVGGRCDMGAVELEAYTLTIASAHGTVAKSPDRVAYNEGDVVQLTVTPATGWGFTNWTGGLISSTNPDSVTIHGNTSVTANYVQEYTLTITSAHGTVAKSPDKATYHEGDVVQLTATPNTDWSFANWTGGLTSSTNPDSVSIHGNTSVTANYIQNTYWIFLPLVIR